MFENEIYMTDKGNMLKWNRVLMELQWSLNIELLLYRVTQTIRFVKFVGQINLKKKKKNLEINLSNFDKSDISRRSIFFLNKVKNVNKNGKSSSGYII